MFSVILIDATWAVGWLPCGYIGPGAGFAFIGSFLILLTAVLLALFSLLSFPVRMTVGLLLRRRRRPTGGVKRVVILGLDGLDPGRVRALMAEGRLPSFDALAKAGTFLNLRTTCPPLSPVAWSSFMTGVNPGKHNIFDFLRRDRATYLPELSSARIRPGRRGLFRRSGAELSLLRRSRPFWQLLGERGIFSTILRVPITFPPEKHYGVSLSAMCTPDLRGTQGSFTVFESAAAEEAGVTGGLRIPVTLEGRRVRTWLPGPEHGGKELRTAVELELDPAEPAAVLRVSGTTTRLVQGEYSDWIPVTFRAGMRKIRGICRFCLLATRPDVRLYVTPINIDPEGPALPISHPSYYAIYLAKLLGPFATLGLAEDTWARSQEVLDDALYLRQVYDIHEERERMFFAALRRARRGLCVCVFDLPDRVQHMFGGAEGPAVDEAYVRADDLLGRTMEAIDDETALFVMSDHGFTRFNRGVNLNAWFRENGYLVTKSETPGADWLADVDWERTKAYVLGLSGVYLNIKGREARGIVGAPDEAAALKREIMAKLTGLRDTETGDEAIRAVYDTAAVYTGPYVENAPDLIVGYAAGYRTSWGAASGRVDEPVFSVNTRAWDGDHCVDPALVPGVFFCNGHVDRDDVHITDVAPTVLSLFGVDVPGYMDGRALTVRGGAAAEPAPTGDVMS